MIKQLIFVFLVFGVAQVSAQVNDGELGESYTYYDSLTHKKVKEIWHHKQILKMLPDPRHYGEFIDTSIYVRNGAYMYYYENGQIQVNGNYRDDQKDGEWIWYDPRGKVTRRERFNNGKPATK